MCPFLHQPRAIAMMMITITAQRWFQTLIPPDIVHSANLFFYDVTWRDIDPNIRRRFIKKSAAVTAANNVLFCICSTIISYGLFENLNVKLYSQLKAVMSVALLSHFVTTNFSRMNCCIIFAILLCDEWRWAHVLMTNKYRQSMTQDFDYIY